MIHTNRRHPQFDLDMEVLCSLAGATVPVPLGLLASDFGVAGQAGVREVFNRLKGNGIEVSSYHNNGKNAAAVHPKHRDRAVEMAQEYWLSVYEDNN